MLIHMLRVNFVAQAKTYALQRYDGNNRIEAQARATMPLFTDALLKDVNT